MTAAASENLRALIGPIQRPSPAICFVVVTALLLGPWLGFYLFDPFGYDSPLRDAWHHVAVLRELMAHPFAPSNPHIPTAEGSRYFTPINILAALVGRGLMLSPYKLFDCMGAAALVGLAGGCWSFGRRYFGSPWAPLLMLLSIMFAWGISTSHAGFHNYATWVASAAYPSSIALVLGLFFWSLLLDALKRMSVLVLVGLAVFSAVIFLTHQLSGAFMIAGAGTFTLFHPTASVRDKALCLAATGAGCLATLAWPYFSVFDVLASTTDDRWLSAFPEQNKLSTAMKAACIPLAGIIGFRNPSGKIRWELAVPAAVFVLAYALMETMGNPIAHRIPPAFILFCQLGIVWAILDRGEVLVGSRDRRGIMAAGAVLLIGAPIFVSVVSRASEFEYREESGSTLELAEGIAAVLPAHSVSFADDWIVYPLQSTGSRVVSIPRPEPAAPSLEARQAATDRFFDERTDQAERRKLIERWGATDVVFVPSRVTPFLAGEFRTLGPSRTFSPGVEVVLFDKQTGAKGGQ